MLTEIFFRTPSGGIIFSAVESSGATHVVDTCPQFEKGKEHFYGGDGWPKKSPICTKTKSVWKSFNKGLPI